MVPWTPLHAQVHHLLKQRSLLPRGSRVLVALSGGQDSLCLIQLLLDLSPKWDWDLAIAHCDHRWRSDSAANAEHVQQLAQGWGLSCWQAVAERPVTTEAAARAWRYAALGQIAEEHGFSRLATGHTQSDRAETLLLNLLRGSGTDGLRGIPWQRPLTPVVELVRPLLALSRQQTGDYCQARQLPIWLDSTNHSLDYRRNRLRHTLLPQIQADFNPQVERVLAQTAELLSAETAYLQEQTAVVLGQARQGERLHRPTLIAAAVALQRRAIQQFLQTYCTPSFDHVEKVRQLLLAPNRAQTDPLPGGAIAYVKGDWICIQPPVQEKILN
jgi:tRNA(Ile)-lysidine synthase